jgi:uncharacterized protein
MLDQFEPHPRLRNGHAMTLFAWARPRRFPALPPPESRLFRVSRDAEVLAHCHWQAERARHPTLIALHGLEGSSTAHYMQGIADKAWARGFNVVRLNQRNCGGTEHLSRTLYHSGLSTDVVSVLSETVATERLQAVAVCGYSLGGNLALKMAGDFGEHPPPELKAIVAVSPTMDLARCVKALERRANVLYQWNFVRNLKARMRRKAACFPEIFTVEGLDRIQTVRQFDERYTAPQFGFRDADDYYHRASALRVVDRIRVPTLILTAADDPFVPTEPFLDPALASNPRVALHLSRHGGHCGFVAAPNGGEAYWAERAIVEFAVRNAVLD